jgi:hypothetical protein
MISLTIKLNQLKNLKLFQNFMRLNSIWFVFCTLFICNEANAQRLTIEVKSSGPLTKVFYGKLNLNEFFIFEKKINLEPEAESFRADNQVDNSELPIAPKHDQSTSKTTLASIGISGNEVKKCMKNKRIIGFIMLANSLKRKVSSAKIFFGEAAESCAQELSAVLRREIGLQKIENNSWEDPGIKIELAIHTGSPATREQSIVTEDRPTKALKSEDTPPLTLDEARRRTELTIDGKQVLFNAAGWFVTETDQNRAVSVELKVPGRKKIVISSFPVNIAQVARRIPNSVSYSSIVGIFSKKDLKIYISEIPFLAQKTSIDGGAGGGLGYGREIPGERRGERLVSMLGVEKRQIFKNFGLRGSLLYTNASKTVVPQTVTLRGSGFYDYSLQDVSSALRFAVGVEIFYSQIIDKRFSQNRSGFEGGALIPSQILAPLLSFSFHQVFRNSLLFAPVLHITPLFISSVGFYPSISPSVDLGYKVRENLFAMVTVGSEVHRFPSQIGETKLQMDYLALTLKRGL